MLHMAADLMLASGLRRALHQRIAGAGIFIDAKRKFDLGQCFEFGYGFLCRFICARLFIRVFVQLFNERMVNNSLLGCKAAHQCQVGFG